MAPAPLRTGRILDLMQKGNAFIEGPQGERDEIETNALDHPSKPVRKTQSLSLLAEALLEKNGDPSKGGAEPLSFPPPSVQEAVATQNDVNNFPALNFRVDDESPNGGSPGESFRLQPFPLQTHRDEKWCACAVM
eukprot:TRINITY_DN24607_c0_g1_i1.p1 TRINITY_DN24607_c0_g1~~TRINITY_DN24607_c0_g1_i1.p1  ORF type:complete len:135 (+),score=20.03 TRINITY_DN24607_c0_g1_i1:72-476(+)